MITATFERVDGGYLLNGSLFLADYPFAEAEISEAAQVLADDIDRRVLALVLAELDR